MCRHTLQLQGGYAFGEHVLNSLDQLLESAV